MLTAIANMHLLVMAQASVTIDVEIADDFVKQNITRDSNMTIHLDGTVQVDKPDLGFVTVNVELDVWIDGEGANSTVAIQPDRMAFASDGVKEFTLTIVVPSDIVNITQVEIVVEGRATSAGFPTVTDHDSVTVMFEYPVDDDPPGPTDPVPDDAIGPNPLIFCGVSILIGMVVAGLVHWNKNTRRGGRDRRVRRPSRTEVVYVPRK